ncbi:MAG: hypothetical protein ACYCTI_09310 [Acidimicrobiales bacterium]
MVRASLLRTWAARLDTAGGIRLVRAAVWALLAASCLSFLVQGANTTLRPHLTNHYLPGTGPGPGPGLSQP